MEKRREHLDMPVGGSRTDGPPSFVGGMFMDGQRPGQPLRALKTRE